MSAPGESGHASARAKRLHEDGWVNLTEGMPEWELRYFVERLHKRHHSEIIELLEGWRKDWMKSDSWDSAPGSDRPGALVARRISEKFSHKGIFVYAAHPSQDDLEEDDYEYSGPRWYVTCTEAVKKHYGDVGVAPPPPAELQELLWPCAQDRMRPWLTELGWTIVPEGSKPQVIHADICYSDAPQPRQHGHGRYHHFGWKLNPSENCTTHVVPGGFTEGCADWDHYRQWTQVKAPAVIFDSEMLHRGAPTKRGIGWSSTLTIQVCSGSGWPALQKRVSEAMMWYTQPLGWAEGDCVDARVDGEWWPAEVQSRSSSGHYAVALESSDRVATGLTDDSVRYRSHAQKGAATAGVFCTGALVDALFDGKWHRATVTRRNGDGTYRVVWASPRSFTDGLPSTSLRLLASDSSDAASTSTRSSRGDKGRKVSICARCRKRARVADAEPRAKQGRLAKDDKVALPPLDGGLAQDVGNLPATPASAPNPPPPWRAEDAAPGQPLQQERGTKEAAGCEREMSVQLATRGYVELKHGFPSSWSWGLFDFVEACYDRYCDLVIAELEMLRDFWKPLQDSGQRYGAFAAAKVTERLQANGHDVDVYSPGESQEQTPPFESVGPRWYVSVTKSALERLVVAPAAPEALLSVITPHPADRSGTLRARGIGWTLAPPGSPPQALHADIWGIGAHARTDRPRWPHILWKRSASAQCTTQIVPGGFTEGDACDYHFPAIEQVRAPAILVDSEALHRGAETPTEAWASTLSIELCTAGGWEAWEEQSTGGTVKDPFSPLDWRMLEIGKAGRQLHGPRHLESIAGTLRASIGEQLPAPPWHDEHGRDCLRREQLEWEFGQ